MQSTTEPMRTIQIQQAWQLQPGEQIGRHRIVAGLGEVSIQVNGRSVYAPFDGQIETTVENCLLFSSPDVPAYLFRLCGLRNPAIGTVVEGQTIGSADYLHFAALRRQPDGTWTMVEPARTLLERLLQ
ncbi:hypothetical protein [Egbenema bharatensis]|uniref:hypothetical protein n=1 Tax=Egbenema bharatensis TaxID=3463334 RepID=UPI003A899375